MLGDAEAIIDGAVAAGGIEAGRGADLGRRNAGDAFQRFGRVLRVLDEGFPAGEFHRVAALGDVGAVLEAFAQHHMGDGVDHGHVGAGLELQVVVGADVGRLDQIDAARIDDDQLRALAQAPLHARREHRVAIGRVGADHDDDIRSGHRLEILRAGGGAEGARQAIAGGRMADAGAGVDVVVLEGGADHLLHHEDFLVGAARGGDAADRGAAILLLDRLEARGGVADRLIPGHFLPRIGDPFTDHRLQLTVLVGGVTPGEAALDAGVALIGAAILVRHHADDLVALHLGLEGAAHAAIGAGGDDGVFRLAHLDHALLGQRGGGAGLDAGAAGDAFGSEEVLVHAGGDVRGEAAAVDGERERALHLFAGAHAARAHDALGRIEGEIGVRFVLRLVADVGGAIRPLLEDVVLAFIAIAHVAQAHGTRHVLQFAIAIGGTGEAIERVVGDVELHHALPQLGQAVGLRLHLDAGGNGGGAGGGRAFPAFDLHEAEAAGAEAVQRVGGAELGDLGAKLHRGAHDGGAFRHGHLMAVDFQCHQLFGGGLRRAVVGFLDQGHGAFAPIPPQAAGACRNLQGNA